MQNTIVPQLCTIAILGSPVPGLGPSLGHRLVTLRGPATPCPIPIPPRAGWLLQAEDRLHRRGQRSVVHVYVLMCHTLDRAHGAVAAAEAFEAATWQAMCRSIRAVRSVTEGPLAAGDAGLGAVADANAAAVAGAGAEAGAEAEVEFGVGDNATAVAEEPKSAASQSNAPETHREAAPAATATELPSPAIPAAARNGTAWDFYFEVCPYTRRVHAHLKAPEGLNSLAFSFHMDDLPAVPAVDGWPSALCEAAAAFLGEYRQLTPYQKKVLWWVPARPPLVLAASSRSCSGTPNASMRRFAPGHEPDLPLPAGARWVAADVEYRSPISRTVRYLQPLDAGGQLLCIACNAVLDMSLRKHVVLLGGLRGGDTGSERPRVEEASTLEGNGAGDGATLKASVGTVAQHKAGTTSRVPASLDICSATDCTRAEGYDHSTGRSTEHRVACTVAYAVAHRHDRNPDHTCRHAHSHAHRADAHCSPPRVQSPAEAGPKVVATANAPLRPAPRPIAHSAAPRPDLHRVLVEQLNGLQGPSGVTPAVVDDAAVAELHPMDDVCDTDGAGVQDVEAGGSGSAWGPVEAHNGGTGGGASESGVAAGAEADCAGGGSGGTDGGSDGAGDGGAGDGGDGGGGGGGGDDGDRGGGCGGSGGGGMDMRTDGDRPPDLICTEVDLFCSGSCRLSYFIKRNGALLRRQVFQLERGVCRSCRLDCTELCLRLQALDDAEARKALIIDMAPHFGLVPSALDALAECPTEGHAWHADHIVPVHRRGGECGLENMQTLCVVCHRNKTREEAEERALDRAGALGSVLGKRRARPLARSLVKVANTCADTGGSLGRRSGGVGTEGRESSDSDDDCPFSL